MALTAMGIKVAINGSETDEDVEEDSASWTTKVGNVRVTNGGGGWVRPANPSICQFDLRVPAKLANRVHTVTIAMTVIPAAGNGTTVTPDDYPPIVGTGAGAYRIIFHGDIQSAKVNQLSIDPTNDPEVIQFDAVSELGAILNRKARVAADTNSGIRELLTDIETAHGLTIGGNDHFATVANGFPNCDRPAQKRVTNGQMIATMLAGTGQNLVDEWDGTITAPTLRWRPDHYDTRYYIGDSTDNFYSLEIGYPWALTYDDIGYAYSDYVARYTVEGEDSAGAQYWGYAELDTSAERQLVGNRNVAVQTYIDTAAECMTQARRLLAYQGGPGADGLYAPFRMNAVTLNTEVYYKTLVDGGADLETGDKDPALETLVLATRFPGDRLYARGTTTTSGGFDNGNSDYDDWPTHLDQSTTIGTLYGTLYYLWNPLMGDMYGGGAQTGDIQGIRQVTRRFTPTGGWDVTFSLLPWSTNISGADVDAADRDSGTD